MKDEECPKVLIVVAFEQGRIVGHVIATDEEAEEKRDDGLESS